MHILILNWRDPKNPYAGGSENYVYKHALFWRKKGAHITWFASSFPNSRKEETLEGISIIRKGSHYTTHIWFFFLWISGKFKDTSLIIDCFHFLPYFTSLYCFSIPKIALIHEVAGRVWYQNINPLFAFIGYHLEPLFFTLYTKTPFITVSNSTKKELILDGISGKSIHVFYNGLASKSRAPIKKSEYPLVLFLGRISEDKGIKDALLAFKNIFKEVPKVKFYIVGKGEKENWLKRYISQLPTPLRQSVFYTGYVDEKEKEKILAASWIILVPSTKEGWGMTVLEAGLYQTPAIGYRVAGLVDSIKNKNTGLLVENNYTSLAKGAIHILGNTILRKNLGNNAEKWAKKFSWEDSTKKSWLLISKLLQ